MPISCLFLMCEVPEPQNTLITEGVKGNLFEVTAAGQAVWRYVNPATGVLAAVAGSPFNAGMAPSSIAVSPNGAFAYVANSDAWTTSACTVNPATGALTPIAGSPFATGQGTTALTVAPGGKYLYVADNSIARIAAFAIDPSTGALSAVSGSPFTSGAAPYAVAATSVGAFVLSANAGGDNISVFAANPATGALTAVAGSPFATGAGPHSIATTNTAGLGCLLDVDGNNTVEPLTDGLMLLRAMFGLTGSAVTSGAVGGGATRSTWAQIQPVLNANCGTHFLP